MSWADDLDLLAQRTRLWRGSWALLVAGALAVSILEREHSRLLAEHEQAEAQWEAFQRLQRQARREQAQAAAPSGPAPTDAQWAAARSLARQLSHPWSDIWGAVEAAVVAVTPEGEAPPVAWLSLAHDAPQDEAEGVLQLEAAVADDAAAWRLVEALSAQPAVADAVLTHREAMNPPAAGLSLRIKLRVLVRPPAEAARP